MTTDSSTFTIEFLGTGAGDFYNHHVRDCQEDPCLRAKRLGGRNIRHASSIFIAPDIMVDFHDPEQLSRHGIAPEAVRRLLITHGHYDHFQPRAILDVAAARPEPLDVYGSVSIRLALEFIAAHAWNADLGNFTPRDEPPNIRVTTLEPGRTLCVGDTTVTAVLANHMIDKKNLILEQPALNYVFERGGKTVFYAIDSSYILPDSFQTLQRFTFDALVLDATFGPMEIDPALSGHHNFDMLETTVDRFRRANLLKPHAVIAASHISCHHVPPHDDVADDLARRGITLAHDGMTLEI